MDEMGQAQWQQMFDQQTTMFTDVVLGLQKQINDLNAEVGRLTAPPTAGQPPRDRDRPVALWWRDRATTDDWDELRAWVDELNSSTSLLDQHFIHECWEAHPGVVEEMAGLYEAWRNAMLSQQNGITAGVGSIETSMWFEQALWRTIPRLRAYGVNRCTVAAHVDDPASS